MLAGMENCKWFYFYRHCFSTTSLVFMIGIYKLLKQAMKSVMFTEIMNFSFRLVSLSRILTIVNLIFLL